MGRAARLGCLLSRRSCAPPRRSCTPPGVRPPKTTPTRACSVSLHVIVGVGHVGVGWWEVVGDSGGSVAAGVGWKRDGALPPPPPAAPATHAHTRTSAHPARTRTGGVGGRALAGIVAGAQGDGGGVLLQVRRVGRPFGGGAGCAALGSAGRHGSAVPAYCAHGRVRQRAGRAEVPSRSPRARAQPQIGPPHRYQGTVFVTPRAVAHRVSPRGAAITGHPSTTPAPHAHLWCARPPLARLTAVKGGEAGRWFGIAFAG